MSGINECLEYIIAKEKIDTKIETNISNLKIQKTDWLIESGWLDFKEMD